MTTHEITAVHEDPTDREAMLDAVRNMPGASPEDVEKIIYWLDDGQPSSTDSEASTLARVQEETDRLRGVYYEELRQSTKIGRLVAALCGRQVPTEQDKLARY